MPRDYETATESAQNLRASLDKERADYALIGGSVNYAGEEALKRPFIPGEQNRSLGLQGYNSQEIGLDNIEDAMRYQPWHEGQQIQGDAVRDALIFAAKAILRNCPRSPRRTLALQHLISARMDANCAISFGGRF